MINLGLKIGLDQKAGTGNSPPPGIPAWAAALRDLVSNPNDFLFAYNFTTGGTGEGWNNVTQELLTVGDALHAPPTFGAWDTSHIINGLGLAPHIDTVGEILPGILPSSVESGMTLFLEMRAASVTNNTTTRGFIHAVDVDDNFDGGLDIIYRLGQNFNQMDVSNGDGSTAATDNVTPKSAITRGASNFTVDGSDIAGSVNGQAVVTGNGSVVDIPPTTAYIQNRDQNLTSDVLVYLTIMAVFALQSSAALPTMSTLP